MSTIASPRASIALSSRRTSTSTDTTVTATGDRSTTTATRRNRAALRDYYNLPAASISTDTATSTTATHPSEGQEDEYAEGSGSYESSNEFDLPTFNPSQYTSELLRSQNLHAIWQAEAQLISAIRNLDGEKKALVYDNYAKLIAATDTIRKMRARMDPLTPATSTLTPAVRHIASTAEKLAEELRTASSSSSGDGEEMRKSRERQRDTVRWVLEAPRRLRGLMDDGKKDEAVEQWKVVDELLTKWEGTKGVEDVRRACEEVMRGEEEDGDGD